MQIGRRGGFSILLLFSTQGLIGDSMKPITRDTFQLTRKVFLAFCSRGLSNRESEIVVTHTLKPNP